MAGEATIEVEAADYVAANRDWWWRAVLVRRTPVTWAVFAAIGFAFGALVIGADSASVAGRLACGGAGAAYVLVLLSLCLGLSYLLLPRRACRLYAQNKAFHEPTVYGWSDAGLSIRSVYGAAVYPWNFYHRWADGRSAILLFITDASFHILPRRALSAGQADEVRALLLEFGPPVR